MKDKQIIIDYEEYQKMVKEIEELKKIRDCFEIEKVYKEFGPQLSHVEYILWINKNELKRMFKAEVVELKENDL